MKQQLVVFAALTLMLFACKKEKHDLIIPPAPEKKLSVAFINISDATSLTILESPTTASYQTNLYKITTSGSLEKVVYLNESGTAIDATNNKIDMQVNSICDIDEHYLVLEGSFDIRDDVNSVSYKSLLVRKSDGAIFEFGDVFISSSFKLGDKEIQKDDLGNHYFSSAFNRMVYKGTISNPASVVNTEYLSTGQSVQSFAIEKNGNCLYEYGYSTPSADIRIRKLNGGVHTLTLPGRNNGEYWVGSNGNPYLITSGASTGSIFIHKINISGNTITADTAWMEHNSEERDIVGQMSRSSLQGSHIIRKPSSVVFIDTYYKEKCWEFSETTNTVTLFSLPPIDSYCKIVNSANYYYIATGLNLYKVSLSNHSYIKLLTTGEYEIYSMCVSNDDILQISALRFSDGKKIYLQIDASGSLTVINEAENRIGKVLKRIK